jgi:hypothetical protein
MRRSAVRFIPPRNSAPATARRRRSSISTAERTVEHRVYGVGILRYLKQIDNGSYAAVVDFAGTERVVLNAHEYWLTPIDALMRLIPVLPPPAMPKPKAKPTKTLSDNERTDDEEGDRDAA